jgi:hypothetical protein
MRIGTIRIHSSLTFCRQAGSKTVQLPSINFKSLLVRDIPVVAHGSASRPTAAADSIKRKRKRAVFVSNTEKHNKLALADQRAVEILSPDGR